MNLFDQTIGHTAVKEVLSRMIEQDRLPHALLLIGPSNVGKTHVATALIQTLFKTNRSIDSIADVTIVKRERDPKFDKRKKQISVKQIRQLTERLSLTPLQGLWKVAFLEEADRLSIGAASALLKTLEEPKGKTLILLRAHNSDLVLSTIASRCQTLRFHPVTRVLLSDTLQKRGLSKNDATTLTIRSFGRPGLALRYLRSSELLAQKDTAIVQCRNFFHTTLAEQFRSVHNLIPKIETDKSRVLARLLDNWSEVLRDNLLNAVGCKDWCSQEAETTDIYSLTRLLSTIQEVRTSMQHNINPHLALEHIFLSTHL